jgi:hypothetical protein
VHFKNDFAINSHRYTIAIGQSESFVIVQDGIEIFNPNGIDWTVKHKPDVFSLKYTSNLAHQRTKAGSSLHVEHTES